MRFAGASPGSPSPSTPTFSAMSPPFSIGDDAQPGKYTVVTVTFVNRASQWAFIKGDRAVLFYRRGAEEPLNIVPGKS
jgi:hypothetical protein